MQNHKQLCMQANLDGSRRVEEKIIQKYAIMSDNIKAFFQYGLLNYLQK